MNRLWKRILSDDEWTFPRITLQTSVINTNSWIRSLPQQTRHWCMGVRVSDWDKHDYDHLDQRANSRLVGQWSAWERMQELALTRHYLWMAVLVDIIGEMCVSLRNIFHGQQREFLNESSSISLDHSESTTHVVFCPKQVLLVLLQIRISWSEDTRFDARISV